MKTFSAALTAHYAQSTTQLAMCWRVERTDAQTFGFTDHDRDIVIDGVTYRADAGLFVSTTQTTDGFNVSTMDVSAFLDISTESEIEAGIWDESVVTMFEVRWDTPPVSFDEEELLIIRHGILGRIDRENLKFTAEVRGLSSRLETRIGRVFTQTCPWRLGDAICGVNLVPFTHTGTITSVGSNARLVFSDSGQSQVAGYFNEGTIEFTSGDNSGRLMDVRRWENKEFLMHRPLPYAVQVGDTYAAVRGDDKRFKTCRDVFDNVQQFGGFSRLPGIDKLMENPHIKLDEAPRTGAPDGYPGYDPNRIGNAGGDGGDDGGEA